MRNGSIRSIGFALGLAIVLAAGHAIAQDAKKKGEEKKGGGPVVLEEIVIEGRVLKPQAFYILQRSSFGFKIMDLKTDYMDEIAESVKDGSF